MWSCRAVRPNRLIFCGGFWRRLIGCRGGSDRPNATIMGWLQSRAMTFLFLIIVSGCGLGAPAALLGTRGVSGRAPVAAAVVGAAAGPAPGIATIYSTALFSASPPRSALGRG